MPQLSPARVPVHHRLAGCLAAWLTATCLSACLPACRPACLSLFSGWGVRHTRKPPAAHERGEEGGDAGRVCDESGENALFLLYPVQEHERKEFESCLFHVHCRNTKPSLADVEQLNTFAAPVAPVAPAPSQPSTAQRHLLGSQVHDAGALRRALINWAMVGGGRRLREAFGPRRFRSATEHATNALAGTILTQRVC